METHLIVGCTKDEWTEMPNRLSRESGFSINFRLKLMPKLEKLENKLKFGY